jgi:hypothetical protein
MTMAKYSIDIGFSKKLLRHPSTSLAALLSQGVTKVGVDGDPLHNARSFKTGDQLVITAYDFSQVTESEVAQQMSIEFFFTPALSDQVYACPIPSGPTFSNSKIYSAESREKSTAFEERGWRYIIELGEGDKKYPQDQLHGERRVVDPNPFTLENPGHFYYTILLAVIWPDDPAPKLFRVDPEMIVSTDDTPPDEKID